MARARAEGGNSVFDVRDLEDLQDIEDECEGEVGEREVVLLAIRSITVLLVILGSVLLTFKVWKRRRGSWKEAAAAVSIQIIWQVGSILILLCVHINILISSGACLVPSAHRPALGVFSDEGNPGSRNHEEDLPVH